jgi:hypothetical protein
LTALNTFLNEQIAAEPVSPARVGSDQSSQAFFVEHVGMVLRNMPPDVVLAGVQVVEYEFGATKALQDIGVSDRGP